MSAGILLSRLIGGALAHALGWRGMLLVFAGLVLVCAAGAWLRLPDARPAPTHSYLATLTALPGLLRRYRALRRAVAAGSLWYFAFSLVWVALTVRLAQPPYGLDAAAIGLYSLAGALGFAALPVAGRLGDRFGPRAVICTSMGTAAAGAALLCTGLDHPAVTAAGLALVDAGCFTAQAANQARILAIDPHRGGSLSGVYLLLYFLAGVVGSALAAPLITVGGWPAPPARCSERCCCPDFSRCAATGARHVGGTRHHTKRPGHTRPGPFHDVRPGPFRAAAHPFTVGRRPGPSRPALVTGTKDSCNASWHSCQRAGTVTRAAPTAFRRRRGRRPSRRSMQGR